MADSEKGGKRKVTSRLQDEPLTFNLERRDRIFIREV
jgi:hypothetical protein